ncbi:Uncharacterized membrane protein YdjX, TVP38/TMEM64 family, SNARE-associated domain [Tistlia consotensis]|uniref:TVP38/TMEM64 family membrane protein n=1 Tax=Tistlia consotensis USBA 355 TaxID=560819 RepID=A0A1Y6BS81_9PROT|nr:VTT domain-containing protein [Tistlia consotensis]SMF26690.1 Uncharacterized membrane protein YdjX, TVP38/TMEM64 family, SNARE-associated domain [Tistlia consotensis USBA 355]SNR66872.1 Uncharacterized membrane protein YdjX, TVP38/TMEM64 family, SNARE-associated domain [Tistlia consotensis]
MKRLRTQGAAGSRFGRKSKPLRPVACSLFLLLSAGVIVAVVGVKPDWLEPAALAGRVEEAGIWAPLIFVELYAAGTLLFLPGSVFALVAGALFGPVWGTLLNLAGATLGASGAFLIARYVASDWVRGRTGPQAERFIRGIEAEGWRFVAFVRLVPLFPFNLTNYGLGLTRIPLLLYVVTSLVCMAPGAVAYSWLGHAGRSALAGDASAIRYGLAALGLLAAIAFLPRLGRRLRRRGPRWIEVDELADGLAERHPTVVDVHSPDEFVGPLGHIAGAVNLPLGDLPGRMGGINGPEDRPVILVCRTDKRSTDAAALLREAGFRDLRVLRGGMEAWSRAGRPIEQGAPRDRSAVIGEGP